MRKKMEAGGRKKEGSYITKGACLRPVGDNSCPLATVQAPCAVKSSNFYFYFYFWGGLLRNFLHFGRMGVQYPHFLKLAPTLGSVRFSIPHGDWRFYFFSNFIFHKFRIYSDHLDLLFEKKLRSLKIPQELLV
jgi:hypothetical protein